MSAIMGYRPVVGGIEFVVKNVLTGKPIHVVYDVSEAQVDAYFGGAYVQDAFPTLNVDERELLVSGLTGPEFDALSGRVSRSANYPDPDDTTHWDCDDGGVDDEGVDHFA